ncbi:MAG TPA: peptidoglycan-binding domain-containing protein [Burkholderiaceae bacterium]|nr:peptidoglycan-binding domain-containing protein [Burkholderiaceae bacterium]
MTLDDIAHSQRTVPLSAIGADGTLTSQLQARLAAIGLLDPPADGHFGPVSQWALRAFLQAIGRAGASVLDASIAGRLLAADGEVLFPLQLTTDLAGRLVRAMLGRGHWLCRHPETVNILYVEGMDLDGRKNGDKPNEFNDLRVLLRIRGDGVPELQAWEATTSPGRFYVEHPVAGPDGKPVPGAARIELGQYKAWSVGTHREGRPGAHEALVQTRPITVSRDLDKNFQRDGDRVFTGLFGINQHWGYDMPRNRVDNASAGCLVGRARSGHREFMSTCKSDARYRVSNGYCFMTAVIGADVVGTPAA